MKPEARYVGAPLAAPMSTTTESLADGGLGGMQLAPPTSVAQPQPLVPPKPPAPPEPLVPPVPPASTAPACVPALPLGVPAVPLSFAPPAPAVVAVAPPMLASGPLPLIPPRPAVAVESLAWLFDDEQAARHRATAPAAIGLTLRVAG